VGREVVRVRIPVRARACHLLARVGNIRMKSILAD
jgi:hypothetical protein